MCQPAVVREFARSMAKHQLLYCAAIIKRNRGFSVGLPRVAADGKHAETLEEYFPFDPYRLRHSRAFIDPFYTSWVASSDAAPDSDDDEDEDSSESYTDDDDDADDDDRGEASRLSAAASRALSAAANAKTLPDYARSSAISIVRAQPAAMSPLGASRLSVGQAGMAGGRLTYAAAAAIASRRHVPVGGGSSTGVDDDNDFLPVSNGSGSGRAHSGLTPTSRSSAYVFNVSPLARSLPSAKRSKEQ